MRPTASTRTSTTGRPTTSPSSTAARPTVLPPREPEAHTRTQERHVAGPANPVPPGPETTPPDDPEWDAERARRDQI